MSETATLIDWHRFAAAFFGPTGSRLVAASVRAVAPIDRASMTDADEIVETMARDILAAHHAGCRIAILTDAGWTVEQCRAHAGAAADRAAEAL